MTITRIKNSSKKKYKDKLDTLRLHFEHAPSYVCPIKGKLWQDLAYRASQKEGTQQFEERKRQIVEESNIKAIKGAKKPKTKEDMPQVDNGADGSAAGDDQCTSQEAKKVFAMHGMIDTQTKELQAEILDTDPEIQRRAQCIEYVHHCRLPRQHMGRPKLLFRLTRHTMSAEFRRKTGRRGNRGRALE